MSNQIYQEVYEAALALLSHDQEGNIERLLRKILEWERNNPSTDIYHGFEWFEVHGDPRTLNSLVLKNILRVTLKTNKCTRYRITDSKAVEEALKNYDRLATQEEVTEEMPTDLFSIIVNHEHKKELIKRSLNAEKPVSCLLWGSVASAKTLFLEDLTKLPHSQFVLGSSLTKAGIFEVLFISRPRYLIIDELDKVEDQSNLTALLSLMERGTVTETKYRRHNTIRLTTWVFASANDIRKIPPELMSRFLWRGLEFQEYTMDEFYEVVVTVLKQRENIPESLALYIAEKVLQELQSRDVRDAVKVARLLKHKTKEDVDLLIEILRKPK